MKITKGDINFPTAILKRFTAVECLLKKAGLEKKNMTKLKRKQHICMECLMEQKGKKEPSPANSRLPYVCDNIDRALPHTSEVGGQRGTACFSAQSSIWESDIFPRYIPASNTVVLPLSRNI